MKNIVRTTWNSFAHLWGRLNGKYYVEDYVRVYPDAIAFNRLGHQREATPRELANFLNHQKFYHFSAQFVGNARVADIGCGSGYGCVILKESGATAVAGADVSRQALKFARKRFGAVATFSEQSITDLKEFDSAAFDVAISSEVLEHILEYGKEDEAVAEVKRITRTGGIVVFGTPNVEVFAGHGFTFDQMDALMRRHFRHFCIFENALIPAGDERRTWEARLAQGRTGIVVTQAIKLDEVDLPEGETPEIKRGFDAGTFQLGSLMIDTRLLHNTHSWIVVAIKD